MFSCGRQRLNSVWDFPPGKKNRLGPCFICRLMDKTAEIQLFLRLLHWRMAKSVCPPVRDKCLKICEPFTSMPCAHPGWVTCFTLDWEIPLLKILNLLNVNELWLILEAYLKWWMMPSWTGSSDYLWAEGVHHFDIYLNLAMFFIPQKVKSAKKNCFFFLHSCQNQGIHLVINYH